MRFLTSALALLPCLSTLVSATALTYKLSANEKGCFFEDISRENSKVAFYFAVC
jgi:ubiquitin carboxyl-terminal hydrolase 7